MLADTARPIELAVAYIYTASQTSSAVADKPPDVCASHAVPLRNALWRITAIHLSDFRIYYLPLPI